MFFLNKPSEELLNQRRYYFRYDFPFSVGVSLGEIRCNRRCRMCPQYSSPPTVDRYMSEDVFERVCREIGDREISFEISAFGETFMHPKADDLLFKAREMCPKATIVVATNGTLLNKKRCEKIIESGINHLSFSLDVGSSESYKWLCNGNNYDQICENLETLVEVRNSCGANHLRITTHIIGINELSHEFQPFLDRWSKIVDFANVRTYGNWAGLVDNNGVSPVDTQLKPKERYPCMWLWYATKIGPTGDVSKCLIHATSETEPLGNIMNQSLVSIWQGSMIRKLRDKHCRNDISDISFCQNCNVWSLFPNIWIKKRKFGVLPTNNWE